MDGTLHVAAVPEPALRLRRGDVLTCLYQIVQSLIALSVIVTYKCLDR
jgi:hypothetical protein